jgi:MFS family permease
MIQTGQPRKAGAIQGIIIILINMLPMMAIVALMPVVPAIVDNFKDMANIMTWAPLVLSAPGLCIALVSPYAGYLTDKFGRRKLLLITMVLYGAGGVLPFFISSFPALMGGRLILGVGEAFVMTIGNVLLGDYFSAEQRSRWLMIQGIISSACGTLLLSLSGYLSVHGWQYPFLVYSIAFVFAIAASFFIFEPQNKMTIAQQESHGKIPLGLIAKLCISTLIASIIYFVYTLQFSLALSAIGIKDRTELGNISAVASIAVPIGALLFKLVAKWPIRLQLLIISALIGIGLTGIGFAHDKATIIPFAFTQQLGCGMLIPVLIAWGLNILPSEFRGRGMGFWSSAFFLGQFISPLVVTGVKSVAGSLLNAFVFFGILCIALGLVNYLFSKNTRHLGVASEMAQ